MALGLILPPPAELLRGWRWRPRYWRRRAGRRRRVSPSGHPEADVDSAAIAEAADGAAAAADRRKRAAVELRRKGPQLPSDGRERILRELRRALKARSRLVCALESAAQS